MPITSIHQLDLKKTYSYADYLSWRLEEQLELLRGKIALMSPAPGRFHQQVVGNLHGFLWNYFKPRPCQVMVAPFDVRLPQASQSDELIFTVVQPDLCVICDPSKLDEKGCIGAPDLVVEVLSPGNTHREMREKFTLYEEAAVKEYWLVNGQDKSVWVYVLEGDRFIGKQPLTDLDQLETDLFPRLVIDLGEVFSKE